MVVVAAAAVVVDIRLVNLVVIFEPNWCFVVSDSVLILFYRTCWKP